MSSRVAGQLHPGDSRRLARHVGAAISSTEAALQAALAALVDPVWRELGSHRAPPQLLRTTFRGYAPDDGYTLLGAYDHLAHSVRLNVRALTLGALLRRHDPDGDACWAGIGGRLHPAAVLEPLAMTLVHELVHAATWREERAVGSDEAGARVVGSVSWPLYEQAIVKVDGRIVGSVVDPRQRSFLEGATDARAAQVLAAVAAGVPGWLLDPAPEPIRAAHPAAEQAAYGARAVVELLFDPAELAALLAGPASWADICDRVVARMLPEESLVASGWLSGELERFAAHAGLDADHPFRRIGWRSLAAWIRMGDRPAESAA